MISYNCATGRCDECDGLYCDCSCHDEDIDVNYQLDKALDEEIKLIEESNFPNK